MTELAVLSPEEEQVVRNAFFEKVREQYLQFINVLNGLPLEKEHFRQAYVHFDTGILWAREAITIAAFTGVQSVSPTEETPAEKAKSEDAA